jgi:hypothetical protein
MSELRERLGVPNSRLYKLFYEKRREYGNLIDTCKAAALVACDNNVRIDKHFSQDFREGLLRLPLPAGSFQNSMKPSRSSRKPRNEPAKELSFTFAGGPPENVPFVTESIAKEASRMSRLYPKLYLFENSARILVSKKMEAVYGTNWWDKVSRKTRELVKTRKQKEDEARWHARREEHEVFYTDMKDLKKIIETNWEIVFKAVLGNKDQVFALFHEIELSRNVIAHNNPLDKESAERLESNFKVWIKQVR